MAFRFHLFLLTLFSSCVGNDIKQRPDTVQAGAFKSFFEFKAIGIEGDTIDFKKYKGKKVLVVNTASRCGYTNQYEDLQKLHELYGDKVVILGFPSNDFGSQEPGNEKQIGEFCKKNFGITFQLFEKSVVRGSGKSEIYSWLSDAKQNGWNSQEPTWNFCKYLINEEGQLIKFYSSSVNPMGQQILSDIGVK